MQPGDQSDGTGNSRELKPALEAEKIRSPKKVEIMC